MAASAQNRTQPDYARDWRRVDTLTNKGLPKSALEIVNRIYAEAKAQKNYPQVAKAAMYRMICRSYADENAYVELVKSVQVDIVDTPEPAKSVLQSVLAEIYWQYFQQNRYKFYNRATVNTVADKSGKSTDSTAADFRTWDARHLVEATTSAYLASVRAKNLLQKTPIGDFDVLLQKGDTDARPLRPTLHDLLAHRALGFFQNTEPDLLKPVFKFELNQPAYLDSPEAFIKLQIQSLDSLSGRYQALLLYQQLVAFHLSGTNPEALADVDVLRLQFAYRNSVVPNKDSIYRQTLEEQIGRYKNGPAEAIYTYQLAEYLANRGERNRILDDNELSSVTTIGPNHWNRKQAADLCRNLVKQYPKSLAGQKAARLLAQLVYPSFRLQLENVTAPSQPFRTLVTYQNVPKLTYRIIPITVAEMITYRDNFNRDEEEKKRVISGWLKRSNVAANTVTLPDDGDLNEHSVEVPFTGLPVGQYLLLATSDNNFQAKIESIQFTLFSISSLSYLLSPTSTDGATKALYVTNRVTGKPVNGISVSIPELSRFKNNTLKTDTDGRFKLSLSSLPTQTAYHILMADGPDTLISANQYQYNNYSTRQEEERVQTHIVLFTDRAIYRPGQLIYVKGLLYEGKQNQFEVVVNKDVKVNFQDQNDANITSQTLKTNEFGTFTATFTAPVGRLTGVMNLETGYGSVSIRVEEYKRPTFEVKIKPIKESFKLGQTVKLTAEAKTFSGAVVDKAEVRYHVVRRLRQRWYWWYTPRNTSQTEITSGTALTDTKGNATILFTALPDLEQARQDNPIFEFEVTIDVSDQAGETRSTSQTLRIGYSALQAELALPAQIEKDDPSTFPIKITNQSDEKVSAKGKITIYKLAPPARPLRNRLWNRPDRQLLSQAEFERLFPNDLYANENDPRFWAKGEIVQEQTVTSLADSTFKPDLNRYPIGEYLAEITVTDSAGETAKDQAFFAVASDKEPTASARIDNWVQVRKTTVEPGSEAIFWVGNAQPGWILFSVEENHKMVRQEWIQTEGRPKRVALPVTEKSRGGFAVHFTMIQNGRLYEKSQTITVPFTNKQLTIETQTFRNKLKPGEREEWTLKISGLDKTPAELVATLYDASLDVFDKLDWQTSFYSTYYPIYFKWQSNSFYAPISNPIIYQQNLLPYVPARHYDELSWLGYRFSFYGNRPFQHAPSVGSKDNALKVTVTRNGKVISGTIKNRDGSGAPGVSIWEKGTSKGASSNTTGKFSLSVDSDSKAVTLVFSFVGYVSQEVTITKKERKFDLLADNQQLAEVVVTGYGKPMRRAMTGAVAQKSAGAMNYAMAAEAAPAPGMGFAKKEADADDAQAETKPTPTQPELINPRRNFNETAFFIPQLKTDEQGRVVLKFTMPEALTRWRLLAFAHTKDLKIGTLERAIVTQKELMITANAPRFLREGDTIRVTARVNNLSEKTLPVIASLALLDALTGEPINQKLKLTTAQTTVNIAAGQGQAVGWTLIVPAGIEAITCRLTAQSGSFTDGEEFSLPILPNRMLVTDSQPFWVNGRETKEFKLKPLINLNPELPVQHERLTVEVTSNPSWYALQSLPYLMEYRYECAEQLFSRLYANSLAAHIVGSKPAFKQVIAEWQKNPPKSLLETNQEVKSVTLENSPWLADARSEADRLAKLAQLLDANRMESEQIRAFEKLEQLQMESGGFRWFGGMAPDLSMTLHILSGLGHLQKLGVQVSDEIQDELTEMQAKAIQYVDAEMKKWVEEQKKTDAEKKKLKTSIRYFSVTQYLYARSFYTDTPVDKALLAYLKQYAADRWLDQSLQGQALTAMALYRFNDAKTPTAILASLRERTRKSEELGMYWPDNIGGLYWYQTPIETQAYLIEAFGEINPVQTEIDDMKRWLLRQKQTQSWSSTKATTEAIYALLLRGSDWLGTGVTTQVSLGGQPIESRVTKADAITGYEKVTYVSTEIKPSMGVIQITKKADGPAWGALYWQHFEPLDKVMPGSAGLSIQKSLYVQRDSPSGPQISPVASQANLKPGDLIKVRLILKTDRVMEYVHLKDGRASGFEPIAALSGYKYQNGLGYYESPRDASTDFFISYLPEGTHVFEYELRVAQTGDFSAGVATVQCFYAPEFSAYSTGERVRVK
ncbi:hypothetical protein GCM10028805_12130 [Spirosoma harenae]